MNTLPIYPRLHALAHLDDSSFQIACSGDEELQMICDGRYKPGHQKFFNQLTDYLYMTRSQSLFDNSLLKFQEGLTWKEFYERLTLLYKHIKNPDLAKFMAQDGKLMELKILFSINKAPDDYGAALAAENSHIDVLQWMKERNLPLTTQGEANRAAYYGDLDVLKFIEENSLSLPDQEGANDAASSGHVDVLQWMKENNLPMPNQFGVNWAGAYGRLKVLKWLKENSLLLPNQHGADLAVQNNQKEVVQWLASLTPPILPPN